ncbi:uncharacterized protein VTP21DRAFT_6192 [Calcarisporiella thermophila]
MEPVVLSIRTGYTIKCVFQELLNISILDYSPKIFSPLRRDY